VFEADPRAIRAMLVNLVENAMDACRIDTNKPRHHVLLRGTGRPDSVRFEVRDNGIGMDRETREKAFTLFFSSKGTEGTGLGLSVSYGIIKKVGGDISFVSYPAEEYPEKHGTTFTVQLPVVSPAAAAGKREPAAPPAAPPEPATAPEQHPL